MRTAAEYREVLMAVFKMKEVEAEDDLNKNDTESDNYNTGYLYGYLAGLAEASRTIEASEFLTE